MTNELLEMEWLGGKNYLARIEQAGRFATLEGSDELVEVKGELRLHLAQAEKGRFTAHVPRFGLVSSGVEVGGRPSGHVSMRGTGGKGHLSNRDGQWLLEVSLEAEVVYEAIGRELGYKQVAEDLFDSARETFRGRLSGIIIVEGKAPEGPVLYLTEAQLHLVYQEEGLGLIRNLVLSLDRLSLVMLAGAGGVEGPALNNPCHPSLQVNRRTLRVQPVGFRSNSSDTSPTGDSATRQFNAVNTIWGKCCIQFDVQPIHIITSSTLKTTSDYYDIRDSYTDSDASTIEVFFAGNNLSSVGGGVAFDGGSAISKVVITDNNVGNDNLLAHELGHTLGGRHPGSSATPPRWVGDWDTVLEYSGSPTIANPDENTHWNCTNADNPAMTTTTTACCLTHDTTDHYIRDFPEDLGGEPATAPAGRNFYSMSNLWNRLSNSAGGVTPDGRPEHQQPVRYSSGATPYTNYMFARVEAIVDLPPRDMVVKFFLKHPGSGGGAAHINLLGSTPVPSTLGPGAPQTVSFPWQVPSGTPQHSCMFAVVRSPAEPDQDITSLGFRDVEDVVRADNDWVQRNLDVGDYPEGNLNQGEPNTMWAAPILIALPRDEEIDEAGIHLVVNAEAAKRLKGLSIEVPGRERHELQPGGIARLDLKTPVQAGWNVPLVLQAIIPGDARLGDTSIVEINPTVQKTALVGYAFEIRINRAHRFLAQIHDIALAAYEDYAELTGSEAADRLAYFHRLAMREQWRSPHRFQGRNGKHLELFKMLIEELAGIDLQEHLGVVESFGYFVDSLGGRSIVQTLSRYRNAVARLQMLAHLMYRMEPWYAGPWLK